MSENNSDSENDNTGRTGLDTLSSVCHTLGSIATSVQEMDDTALESQILILKRSVARLEKEEELAMLTAKVASYHSTSTSSTSSAAKPVEKSVIKTYTTDDNRVVTTTDIKGKFLEQINEERPVAVTLDPRRFPRVFKSGNMGIDTAYIRTELENSAHETSSRENEAISFLHANSQGLGVNTADPFITTIFLNEIKDLIVMKDPIIFKRFLFFDNLYNRLSHLSISHFIEGALDLTGDLDNMDKVTLEKRLRAKDQVHATVQGPKWLNVTQSFIYQISVGIHRNQNMSYMRYKYEEACAKLARFLRDFTNAPLSDEKVILKYQELLAKMVIDEAGERNYREKIVPELRKDIASYIASLSSQPVSIPRMTDVAGDVKRKAETEARRVAKKLKAGGSQIVAQNGSGAPLPTVLPVKIHPCVMHMIETSKLFAATLVCKRASTNTCAFSHDSILTVKKSAALASIRRAKATGLTATETDTLTKYVEANCTD